jgi:hypothetical protein
MEPVALRLQVAPEEKMLWGEEEKKDRTDILT